MGTGRIYRGSVRTVIYRRESVISFLILLILAAIGISVYIKGQIYDPGLFSLEIAALKKNPSRQEDYRVSQLKAGITKPQETALPTALPRSLLFGLAPEGWTPMGEVEEFNPDTLYEKIDGRAEQYLDYRLIRLSCGSFVNGRDGGKFIDVYIFDMGTPVRAFGAFSAERSEGLPSISLGREGYRAESGYFFWKGRYYIQVLASDKSAGLAHAGLEIAGNLAKKIADDGKPIWGLTFLPEKDRIPGSAQYFLVNAMSLEFMQDTYIAAYRKEGGKILVFLSKKSSPEAAAEIVKKYEDYLNSYGKVVAKTDKDGYPMVMGDMGGTYDCVFQRGVIVGGVSMAASRATAEKAAEELFLGIHL